MARMTEFTDHVSAAAPLFEFSRCCRLARSFSATISSSAWAQTSASGDLPYSRLILRFGPLARPRLLRPVARAGDL